MSTASDDADDLDLPTVEREAGMAANSVDRNASPKGPPRLLSYATLVHHTVNVGGPS
jgi:hypothetical protein